LNHRHSCPLSMLFYHQPHMSSIDVCLSPSLSQSLFLSFSPPFLFSTSPSSAPPAACHLLSPPMPIRPQPTNVFRNTRNQQRFQTLTEHGILEKQKREKERQKKEKESRRAAAVRGVEGGRDGGPRTLPLTKQTKISIIDLKMMINRAEVIHGGGDGASRTKKR
jgi:hypothetical protein